MRARANRVMQAARGQLARPSQTEWRCATFARPTNQGVVGSSPAGRATFQGVAAIAAVFIFSARDFCVTKTKSSLRLGGARPTRNQVRDELTPSLKMRPTQELDVGGQQVNGKEEYVPHDADGTTASVTYNTARQPRPTAHEFIYSPRTDSAGTLKSYSRISRLLISGRRPNG